MSQERIKNVFFVLFAIVGTLLVASALEQSNQARIKELERIEQEKKSNFQTLENPDEINFKEKSEL